MTDRTDRLRWRTPPGWAASVLADELALLSDHAHLEHAAAANALALVRRWPDGVDPARWVGWLSGVARDEVEPLAGGTEDRWSWWLDVEAGVSAAQEPGPRVHSGAPYAGR